MDPLRGHLNALQPPPVNCCRCGSRARHLTCCWLSSRRHRARTWYCLAAIYTSLALSNHFARPRRRRSDLNSRHEISILLGFGRATRCCRIGATPLTNLASPCYNSSLLDLEALKFLQKCVCNTSHQREFMKKNRTRVWAGETFEVQVRWNDTRLWKIMKLRTDQVCKALPGRGFRAPE